jgi:hypothetical protein
VSSRNKLLLFLQRPVGRFRFDGQVAQPPADGTSRVGSLRISAAAGNLEIDPVSPAQELITNRSTRLTLIILADSQLATQID